MMPFVSGLIATGLGKVANALMEKGVAWVEDKAGIKIEPDQKPTPEQLLSIRQFELEHEAELTALQVERDHISADLYRAALGDLQDARNREVQIATSEHAPKINKVIVPLLAIGVLLLTFVLFGAVMFAGDDTIGADRKELMVYVLGVLSAIATQVVQYYFGSSSGSKEKTGIISGLSK